MASLGQFAGFSKPNVIQSLEHQGAGQVAANGASLMLDTIADMGVASVAVDGGYLLEDLVSTAKSKARKDNNQGQRKASKIFYEWTTPFGKPCDPALGTMFCQQNVPEPAIISLKDMRIERDARLDWYQNNLDEMKGIMDELGILSNEDAMLDALAPKARREVEQDTKQTTRQEGKVAKNIERKAKREGKEEAIIDEQREENDRRKDVRKRDKVEIENSEKADRETRREERREEFRRDPIFLSGVTNETISQPLPPTSPPLVIMSDQEADMIAELDHLETEYQSWLSSFEVPSTNDINLLQVNWITEDDGGPASSLDDDDEIDYGPAEVPISTNEWGFNVDQVLARGTVVLHGQAEATEVPVKGVVPLSMGLPKSSADVFHVLLSRIQIDGTEAIEDSDVIEGATEKRTLGTEEEQDDGDDKTQTTRRDDSLVETTNTTFMSNMDVLPLSSSSPSSTPAVQRSPLHVHSETTSSSIPSDLRTTTNITTATPVITTIPPPISFTPSPLQTTNRGPYVHSSTPSLSSLHDSLPPSLGPDVPFLPPNQIADSLLDQMISNAPNSNREFLQRRPSPSGQEKEGVPSYCYKNDLWRDPSERDLCCRNHGVGCRHTEGGVQANPTQRVS